MSVVKHLPTVEEEVPHEPGNYLTFRRLSASEVDEARAKGQEAIARQLKLYADLQAIIPPDQQREAERQARQQEAPQTTGMDKATLVRYGVVAWRGPLYDTPCDDDGKGALDEPTRDWAAKAIARMSTVSLGEARSSGDGSGPTSAGATSLSISGTSGSPS